MKRLHEAQLNMLGTVINLSDANAAITGGIAAYGTTITSLTTLVATINTTAKDAKQVITGITANKVKLKAQVSQSATAIAAGIFSYAASLPDPDVNLEEKSNFPLTFFTSKKDGDLNTAAQNIYTLANGLVDVTPPATNPLAPFGITADVLTAFQTLIGQYNDTISGPRSAIAVRKSCNSELAAFFRQAQTILKKQLDKLALQLSVANPQFYKSYLSARKVVTLSRHTQIAGTITDANGKPIAGATVTAMSQAYTFTSKKGVTKTIAGKTYTATADANGNYSLSTSDFRTSYTLQFSKTGYVDVQQANLTVNKGKTTTQNITMTAGA